MVNCTKCGKVILRQERGNVKSSRDVDGFEHKDCSIAIGPFPDNPIINAPKPSIKPVAKTVVMEPETDNNIVPFQYKAIEEFMEDESR